MSIVDWTWLKGIVKKEWKNLTSSGTFVMTTGKQSGRSWEQAICTWLNDNAQDGTNFDEKWAIFEKELTSNERVIKVKKNIEVSTVKKTGKQPTEYTLSDLNNPYGRVTIKSQARCAWDRVKEEFDKSPTTPTNAPQHIAEQLHGTGETDFDSAKRKLLEQKNIKTTVEETKDKDTE